MAIDPRTYVPTSVRVPIDLRRRLRIKAVEEEITLQMLIIDALEKALAKAA